MSDDAGAELGPTNCSQVYIFRDGLLLCLDDGQGLRYVPGGYIDTGESDEDAAYREVLEETGLTLGELHFMRRWAVDRPDGDGQQVQAVYWAESAEGEVILSEEHVAFNWLLPAQLGEFWTPLADHDALTIRQFAAAILDDIRLLERERPESVAAHEDEGGDDA